MPRVTCPGPTRSPTKVSEVSGNIISWVGAGAREWRSSSWRWGLLEEDWYSLILAYWSSSDLGINKFNINHEFMAIEITHFVSVFSSFKVKYVSKESIDPFISFQTKPSFLNVTNPVVDIGVMAHNYSGGAGDFSLAFQPWSEFHAPPPTPALVCSEVVIQLLSWLLSAAALLSPSCHFNCF